MSTYETPSYEMVVVAFEDEYKADEVLSTLKQLDVEATVDLKSAAVVKRDAEGKVRIKETKDFDAKQGAIGGAVAGGLLGLLTGKLLVGALVGAAGGAAAGHGIDLGIDDEYLKAVGESLGNKSSALVALVAFERVDRAMAELEKFEGGSVLRHTLSDDVYQQLSDAIED
ncbi:MAG TPA: DUF1269 domain-containing protein [Anaerolineae bacterium]|nr:DUF1269 domain-containing protein [Anaerolineae bacterium]